MITDITFGQYYPSDSVFHRLDARMKIILCVAYTVSIFLCKTAISLATLGLITFLVILLTKIPIKTFWKNVKPILPIIVITAILNLIYIDGNIIWQYWIFKISDAGIRTAVFVVVRIVILVVSTSILTYTTTPTELTCAIEKLFAFLKYIKVDIHTLAMMMTIALRFIPTLIDEINKIMNAQKARGADVDSGGLLKRAKALIPVLIPLFISAFRRAYDLAYAMECRCYHGGVGRTKMKIMKYSYRDIISLVVMAGIITGVVFLNMVYIGGF